MTLLEVITGQVSASSLHALPNSPLLPPHLRPEEDPEMPVGPITKSNLGAKGLHDKRVTKLH